MTDELSASAAETPVAGPDDGWTIGRATTGAELEQAFEIRRQVFVEGQDCPPEEEFDDLDGSSRHVLGRLGGRAVATARWRIVGWQGGRAAKLERFAVLAEHRGRGLGARLVEHLLAETQAAGLDTAILHAQAHLERFYAGFGFEPRGEEFVEAGIPHLLMVRRGNGGEAG